jgi:hypothetical protein
VKIASLSEGNRDPGHIPSLPNHASALHKKTKSFTPKPIHDIDKVQPSLQQLFKEEGPDPMMPSPQELETGYLQPQQPQGMPPQGMGMPMGKPQGGMPMGQAPGGSPMGIPMRPGMKTMVKGKTTGNTLSEMI